MADASSAWENEGQQQRESDKRRGGEAARWVKMTNSRTLKIQSKEGNTVRYVHALAHRVGSVNVQAQTPDSCDAPMWNFHFKAACHLNGKIVITICITGLNAYTLTWRGPCSQVFSSLVYLYFFGGADLVFYLILYLFFYYTVSTPQGSLHLSTSCKYNMIYPKHTNKTNWHIRGINKIKCKSKLSRVNTISSFCQNKTRVWTNLFFPLKRPNDQS